jgi:hypothetical protein
MNLLNLPVSNLVPLGECLWIIFGIIFAPILLGILTILNDNGVTGSTTRIVFYLVSILAIAVFAIIAPKSALMSLVLTTIVSILVSYFGGENFSWFRAIK